MTIYDIAREAGVSASTVSRVINNKPGVNEKTRQTILALLEKLHYVPNEAARGLVTNSSRLVGILVADIRNQHHIEGAYYIADELAKLGYCALVLNTGGSDEERARGIEMLEQRKVEAAVLMGSIFQAEAVRNAIACCLPGVPVFMLNGYLDLPNVHGVLSDDRGGTRACVEMLCKEGKKHPVFLVDQPTPSSQLKQQGFGEGVRAVYGREGVVLAGVEGTHQGGYEAAMRVFNEYPQTDAVICSLDIIACGVLRAAAERGLHVGKELAVVGTDNSVYCEICTPKLTSLDTLVFESGVMIARKLVDSLEGKKSDPVTMLTPKIVRRESA